MPTVQASRPLLKEIVEHIKSPEGKHLVYFRRPSDLRDGELDAVKLLAVKYDYKVLLCDDHVIVICSSHPLDSLTPPVGRLLP